MNIIHSNSNGNGSAMRVSPVGLYVNSMEEALEYVALSNITFEENSANIGLSMV